jgi:hypothetical protein
MLEQAIVDAKALREAAVKSAESELLEKYADEMKQAVTTLLEVEADMGFDAAPPTEAPPSYADGENLCPCPEEGEELEIDFSDLRAQAEEASDEGEADGLGMGLGGEEDLGGGFGDELGDEEGGLGLGDEEEDEEELSLQEQEMLKKLFSEDVILDMMKEADDEEEEKADSDSEDDESEEESEGDVDALKAGFQAKEESLMRAVSRLSENLKKQKKSNTKYKNVIHKMTSRLAEVNLSNAKLLYTNRVLNNTSLNERQKNKIVESIGKSGSVNEAKTIFDTLQNAVSGAPSRNGKSHPSTLSEAVRRNASPYAIRGNSKEPQNANDAFSERMRRLAGITNK